jgi:putative hydrolases of HD superfamily
MIIDDLISFISFSQDFRDVERDVPIRGTTRVENDFEHSYQLAMTAWFLSNSLNLGYNREKLLVYSLIHDLVEVYAGDTPAFTSTEEKKLSKDSREALALKKIAEVVPSFSDLKIELDTYHSKNDPESKFVYVIDKIMPMLNQYPHNTSHYPENNVTFEKWRNWLISKLDRVGYTIDQDKAFIKDFLFFLEEHKESIFANEKI